MWQIYFFQENAFEEIADLFNNDVFPLDRTVNIYEKLDKSTEMKIEKKDGKLYFKKLQITSPSHFPEPSEYTQSQDHDFNEFNFVQTECSDGSDYVRL